MDPAVSITFAGHATLLVEQAGARILTDPLLRPRLAHIRRAVAPVRREDLDGVDAVLVSHIHADHLDPWSLRLVDAPRVLVPRGIENWRGLRGIRGVEPIGVGERVRVGDVEVVAVPARHADRRTPGGTRVPPLGFVLEGPQRVYFAGDTDLFGGMADLAPLDVALLPVWGWGRRVGPGHLTPQRAARALAALQPRVAVPIHWGTYASAAILPRELDRFLSAPPREFARHAAQAAPDVEVAIVEPGGTRRVTPAVAATP